MISIDNQQKELDIYFRNGIGALSCRFEPFWTYLKLLLKWNSKINLTSIKDPKRIVEEHFIDSLAAIPYLEKSQSLLDIGSGAGFPGLPLAIALPNLQTTLCESIKKKADFLREVVRHLDLKNITIENTRLQEGAGEGHFDTIVSRGTTDLSSLLKLSTSLLVGNGQLISYKGPEVDRELNHLKSSEIELERRDYFLPYSKKKRVLIVIRGFKGLTVC